MSTSTVEGDSSTSNTMRAASNPQQTNNWLITDAAGYQVWTTTGSNDTLNGSTTASSWAIEAKSDSSTSTVYPSVMISFNVILSGRGTSSAPWYINPTLMTSRSSPATCSITVSNASTYETSKTLTASVTLNGATLASSPYSWNSGSYTSSSTKTVSAAGSQQLTIKDTNSLTIPVQ